MTNHWQELELEYARRLRVSGRDERRQLYGEAYSAVSEARASAMPEPPEKRTAGTSPALVRSLIRLCDPTDRVLEVGCGRGYTCLNLASHVASVVGLDVSDPALDEAQELLDTNGIANVRLQKGFADELTQYFGAQAFDKVISIDVYEHLHPEDGTMHLTEVFAVLKPAGEFIVVTPNHLTGPHDITRQLFPSATEPVGFHLNETTCSQLIEELRGVGFTEFRSVLPLSCRLPILADILYPPTLDVFLEKQYQRNTTVGTVLRALRVVGRVFLIARRL
jgi:2-polyprenyl-3-methyl-5-hydroxy-6-metoxy-1,4-benzoquinol methylase